VRIKSIRASRKADNVTGDPQASDLDEMNAPPIIQPAVLQTPGFAHYATAWSPFHNNRLALASAANFGLVGNGRLHIVSIAPMPALTLDKQ
jgi:peroxin-7